MNYNWILFDADNTLFDFSYSQEKALEESMESFGIKYKQEYFPIFTELNTEIWQAFDENKISHEEIKTERFIRLFNQLKIAAPNLNDLNTLFINKLIEHSTLIENTENIIKHLYGKVSMAIITNGMKEVQRPRFNNCKISNLFDEIFISGEIGKSKPDNDYFQYVFDVADITDKSKCLVVGDNIYADIQGGKEFGFDTCWFNPHNIKSDKVEYADYEIKKIQELIDIL